MEESILVVKNLNTKLLLDNGWVDVVDNLSFALKKHRTLALIGESGCGKTITALSLMRILPDRPVSCSTGEILYQGRNLNALKQKEMSKIRGYKIAMIFQDPSSALNPVYTVGTQLVEVANLHLGMFGEIARQKALVALAEVGLPNPIDLFDSYPHQLSGGMKQRVMIAMALMCEPDILIADEPTTALDVTIQSQILDLISDRQKKNGMALLLITHDMTIVAKMADDVVVMYAGQSIEKGTKADIFDHMAHPYTKGLFASRPSLHAPRSVLPSIKGSVPSIGNFPCGCRFHPRCPFVMKKCKLKAIPEFVVDNHVANCLLYEEKDD